MNVRSGYQPIQELLTEISKAQDAGALIAALSLVYVGIDTMAWLSLPIGERSHNRNHFIAWVEKYLKADQSQPYQYIGVDLYAARCALLHSYGSIADLHQKPNPPTTFGYLDNGPHQIDSTKSFVLISIAVLIYDFFKAVTLFMKEALRNHDLKSRIDSRIDKLITTSNIQHQN